MCVCVRIHTSVCVCVCVYTCVCVHTYIYVCVCVCVYVWGRGTFYQISPFAIRAGPHNPIKQNCCSQQTKMNMSILDAMIAGLTYGPVS